MIAAQILQTETKRGRSIGAADGGGRGRTSDDIREGSGNDYKREEKEKKKIG